MHPVMARAADAGRCARSGLALVLALSVSGCVATRPPHGIDGEHGMVWAATEERAQVVARLLDEVVPGVRALFPDTAVSRESVWVEDSLAPWMAFRAESHVLGLAVDARRRVVLRWSEDEGQMRSVLAHELVHVCLAPTVWRGLPEVIEDALCDAVALQVAPTDWAAGQQGLLRIWALCAVTREPPTFRVEWSWKDDPESTAGFGSIAPEMGEALREGRLPSPHELLMSRNESWSRDEAQAALGLAAFVMDRIVAREGLEGAIAWLHAWAADGGSPEARLAALLGAADLAAEASGWVPQLRDGITPQVLTRQLTEQFTWELDQSEEGRRAATGLVRSIGLSWTFVGVSDPETIWAQARPRFVLEGTDLSVPVRDVAPLRELAEDLWPRMPAGALVPTATGPDARSAHGREHQGAEGR